MFFGVFAPFALQVGLGPAPGLHPCQRSANRSATAFSPWRNTQAPWAGDRQPRRNAAARLRDQKPRQCDPFESRKLSPRRFQRARASNRALARSAGHFVLGFCLGRRSANRLATAEDPWHGSSANGQARPNNRRNTFATLPDRTASNTIFLCLAGLARERLHISQAASIRHSPEEQRMVKPEIANEGLREGRVVKDAEAKPKHPKFQVIRKK